MARVVALTNGSPHSWIIVNAIAAVHGPVTVLIEANESKSIIFRKRMKRHGFITVVGQTCFVLLQKFLERFNVSRIAEITQGANVAPAGRIHNIPSVNSSETLSILAEESPEVVVVFGTQLIGKKTLSAINVPLINFHSGINPTYRGQAGGYWALAMGDKVNAGVTVHLIDAGVDTGEVLYQGHFAPTSKDSFNTYYYLQAVALCPLAVRAVADAFAKKLKPFTPDLPSQQFFQPTIWFYMWTGLTKGVW